ncbi:MAG: sulfatase-like hydrolase/transferase [Planctomycetota bacterium]
MKTNNQRCQIRIKAIQICFVLSITTAFCTAEELKQPNFVIILADDLGYGDCGFTGSKQIKTPHIDSLALDGIVCSQGYVSAPVCAPSRAGLLTGRNQPTFGFDNNLPSAPLQQFNREHSGLPVNVKTIANRLDDLGYINGIVGKWHLGEADHFHPLKRGFHEFWGYLGGGHDYFKTNPKSKASYLRPIICNYKKPQPLTYLTDDKGDECVDFIRRHKDKPFFLYASFNAPHGPLQATEDDLQLYSHMDDKARQTYCAMIHRLDQNVGRIIEELKAHGLYEDTLVIFLSDNGGPVKQLKGGSVAGIRINAPYRGSKGTLLEGGIHVPFVVSMPGRLEGGTTFSQPVSSLDLTPTFVELAGGSIKDGDKLDGVNLVPFLQGREAMDSDREFKWRFTISGCLREGDWKLIRLPDRLPMLFDLKNDQAELEDLAETQPERVRDMLRRFGDWDVSCPHPQFLEGDRYRRSQIDLYDTEYNLSQPESVDSDDIEVHVR